ncbi:hypothetical protein GCM10010156_64020 [Planobispora rosea]|uniref:Peptidase C51 domain-containing protein n=1 Tax=Planobispora rosea TaxID=35762 RepID=A0A8J3S5R5_PLARO|nr:CHAP domain-containing protein [Planobispora rosea]GGS97023.1 hypothetical protein GCM10010156_64020 [Planobispora rosea]GIH87728.1 hypothetical protein Pro02_61360 [Planobispora rosea]
MTEHHLPRLLPGGLLRAAAGAALAVCACAVAVGAPASVEGLPPEPRARTAPAPAGVLPPPVKTGVTAADMLRIAESQIGIAEDADGGGTKFHSWYMESARAQETLDRDGGVVEKYTNAPWCAMFVSWVGEQAGLRRTVGADAYAVAWAGWFQDRGRWGDAARPGALVYFDLDEDGGEGIYRIDHMGLVKQDNGDGTITTIEGNTDRGLVEQRIRRVSEVIGYGYPEYPGDRPAGDRGRAGGSPAGR